MLYFIQFITKLTLKYVLILLFIASLSWMRRSIEVQGEKRNESRRQISVEYFSFNRYIHKKHGCVTIYNKTKLSTIRLYVIKTRTLIY